ADVEFPMIVYQIIHADRGQDVEGKVLSLPLTKLIGAIDKAGPDPTRGVRLQAPARAHKNMAESGRNSEVVIFRSAKNWFRHGEEVNLVISAKDTVVVAIHAPTQTPSKELRTNLVTVRIADETEQVGGFGRKLEMGRLEGISSLRGVFFVATSSLAGRCS